MLPKFICRYTSIFIKISEEFLTHKEILYEKIKSNSEIGKIPVPDIKSYYEARLNMTSSVDEKIDTEINRTEQFQQ